MSNWPDIHQAYVDQFIRIGKDNLAKAGYHIYKTEIKGPGNTTSIFLEKGKVKLIVYFGDNRLDYTAGVMVRDLNKNFDQSFILPKGKHRGTYYYSYSGDNLERDTKKLIRDILRLKFTNTIKPSFLESLIRKILDQP